MPTFIVERYEVYTQQVSVEAKDEADAIVKVLDGEGDEVDNSLEYIESCEEYGITHDENPELVETVSKYLTGNKRGTDTINGIRSVEEE